MKPEEQRLKKGVSVPLYLLYDKVKYSLQYVDYADDQWTVPVLLTEERAEKFCEDLSLKRVKIMDGNTEWILDVTG